MLGGQGAATIVIAQPDDSGRELLARIVEAAGQHAVRLDTTAPPELVDRTVDSSALIVVVDVTVLGLADLRAVIDAFTTRRYPAQVVALVDGPASAAAADAAGAAAVLERPFARAEFEASLTGLLGPDLFDLDRPSPPSHEAEPATVEDRAAAAEDRVEPEPTA